MVPRNRPRSLSVPNAHGAQKAGACAGRSRTPGAMNANDSLNSITRILDFGPLAPSPPMDTPRSSKKAGGLTSITWGIWICRALSDAATETIASKGPL
jgi:hypothetical protein